MYTLFLSTEESFFLPLMTELGQTSKMHYTTLNEEYVITAPIQMEWCKYDICFSLSDDFRNIKTTYIEEFIHGQIGVTAGLAHTLHHGSVGSLGRSCHG